MASSTLFHHPEFDDEEYGDGESFAVQAGRHIQELQRLRTKVPPAYDGRSSWFAYEDAIGDWVDITELEPEKQGPALRNRLEGEAAIHKRLLDRDKLKDKVNGVKYFKSYLRPLFVKGASNVFLYRFQQFMTLHRGSNDMLRWITRFQLSRARMQEAWDDTYVPITDVNNPEVRAYVSTLTQEEQNTITPEDALSAANARMKGQHSRTIPITENLVALMFVSLADLTQDQRQVLTSLMAHRNRPVADYRIQELREVYLEVFCTTRTSVENPLLAPSGHAGRKTFLVLDEGYLDTYEGFWVEDEEDGAEGFLELDEDTFWVFDDDSAAWFQRRFQGRKMRRGKGGGKRKGKGKGKGRGGRRFFKKKKGRSHMTEDQSDAWQAWDWQDQSWDEDWSWQDTEESYAAKGKGKKGKKGKGKGKWSKDGKGDGKDHFSNAASESSNAPTSQPKAIAASTFFTMHNFSSLLEIERKEEVPDDVRGPLTEQVYMATPESETSYLTHALTPTSMVLDLGCTRAMTSWRAAKDLMEFCDKNPDCGLWYRLDQTTSQFTFANSESASCKQKIVVCMYDVDYAVQSTEFDIVEQGEVPTLMSLPQMRNLRFQFDLHPDKAYLSSPVLGIKNMNLKVARSTHLILDLLDVCEFMWNVKFEKHKKVSFFTDHKHFEFGYNQNEEVFALDDEWIMNEPEMELIRLHKRERHQTFLPSSTPIPPEFLDSKRKTILEFKNGKKEVKEDDWKASVKTKQFHSPQAWKGKTIFKILPGGIENRTSVKVRSAASGPKRRGKPDDELIKAKKGEPEKSSGSSPLGEVPATRKSKKGPISKPAGGVPFRTVPQDGDNEEDPFKDLGLLPAEDPPPRSGPVGPEPGMEDAAEYEPSEHGNSGPIPEAPQPVPPGGEALEPRRISLPLPGQEVSRASPAYQRMLEKLRSDVELYKLHVKHYHMSPAQFRRRTSMLGLPGEIYDRYDRIVKSCKICSTSVPSPPRARIAGLRASSFGDLIVVDHAEINYGMNSYLVLLVIDGATNLLWATALTSLDAPETLGALRLWIEENNCMPKGIVGDQAFFADPFMDFYRFHGISPYPCGPRTPWPNRAETAVRLFKRAWVHMAKALTEEGYVDRVTVRQAVKKVVWARNCQLTVSGYSPLEIATGRRPPDLFDIETSTPEQLSAEPPEEDRTMLQLQRIALRAHQEARQALDLRKDIARRVMPSDGPYSLGDKVFVWMKDESKKKAEGIWVRGKVVSQEGAMVLVQVHKSVLRVNQSKVRRDHDPWHDVAIPLNPEPEVKEEGAPDRSQFSEGTGHHCSCCYEHEISYHTYTEKRSDFVEISASASGLTACVARSGMLAGVPILGEQFNMKKVQQSISQAWKTIANNDPEHVIIHPVVPKQWNEKATKAFWKFCADVARWQDNRGCFVTIIYPRGEGFWSSQGCRSLLWRYSFHSEELSFSRDPKVWSLTLKSNLPEGTFGRLHALDRFSGDDMSLDPRFVVLMTSCLIDQCVSDHRQECLFEDLLEDFDDGSLCALSLRSDRNNHALSAIPTKEEFSALGVDRGKLPKGLQFVSPQRFVTLSLVQALGEIDRLLPGTELEIHTSTSKQALSLKPSLKSVRVLTLPHMEFEFCNVYRGTFGKTLPLLQRHPDAVVVLWNPNDYDHVFFVTLSQLVPCLKQMNADHWSMIVFWSEGTKTRPSTSPDVGLDYTDEPVPLPPPDMPPQTDGAGNDDDTPGPSAIRIQWFLMKICLMAIPVMTLLT